MNIIRTFAPCLLVWRVRGASDIIRLPYYLSVNHIIIMALLPLVSASQARRILLLWHCCLPVCLPLGLVCLSSQLYRRMRSAYLYLGYSLSYHMCVRIHIRRYRRIHRIRMSWSAYSYNYIVFGVLVTIYIWRISLFQNIRLAYYFNRFHLRIRSLMPLGLVSIIRESACSSLSSSYLYSFIR